MRLQLSAASRIFLDSALPVLVMCWLEDFRIAVALLPLFLFCARPSPNSTKSFRMNVYETPRFALFYRFLSRRNPRRMNTYKAAPQVFFLKDLRNVSNSLKSTLTKKGGRGCAGPSKHKSRKAKSPVGFCSFLAAWLTY
jgi:hypothetical protein